MFAVEQRKPSNVLSTEKSGHTKKDEEIEILMNDIKKMKKHLCNMYIKKCNLKIKRARSIASKNVVEDANRNAIKMPNAEQISKLEKYKKKLKFHEFIGSTASWLKKKEFLINFKIPCAQKPNEYCIKFVMDNNDMWNVDRSYLPDFIDVNNYFEQFSEDLGTDEVQKVSKLTRDYCFCHQMRKNQVEELMKSDFKKIKISCSICYTNILLIFPMIYKNELLQKIIVNIRLTYNLDGIFPRKYVVESAGLSDNKIEMLYMQLRPLLKYDLLDGLEISMIKQENTMFVIDNSDSTSNFDEAMDYSSNNSEEKESEDESISEDTLHQDDEIENESSERSSHKKSTFKQKTSKKNSLKKNISKRNITKKNIQRVIPKSEMPKRDTRKRDSPKQGTPKKDTPKKDTPKQGTPKKDTPKQGTPKKNTPKKDIPRRDIRKRHS